MTDFETASLGAPFHRIFSNLERAEEFRFWLDLALRRLGPGAIDDPRCNLSVRGRRMNMSYGQWLVLGVRGNQSGPARICMAMPAEHGEIGVPVQQFEAFARQSEDDSHIELVYMDFDTLMSADQHVRSTIQASFEQALDAVRSRFEHWESSPFRKSHVPELMAAASRPDAWTQIVRRGHEVGVDLSGLIRERLQDPSVSKVKIAPGPSALYWADCLEEDAIFVGWDAVGDLRAYSTKEAFVEAFVQAYPEGNERGHQVRKASELWTLMELRPGDIVAANRGKSEVLALGLVREPGYKWRPDREVYQHSVHIDWDTNWAQAIPSQAGWGMRTVWPLEEHVIEALLPSRESQVEPAPSLLDLVTKTGVPLGDLERWVRGIERRGQAVLYGPPGTGKTYLAKHLAKHLVGDGDGFVELVQFHPAYAYEDFIQGLRPTLDSEGQLGYELTPGRFMGFVERATARAGTCVLIIDEINRANLARVLGELMYLLEYRGETTQLATGNVLSVPTNVRILATMNTADRSIAMVDHALRRRFAFLPVRPNLEVLRRFHRGKPGEAIVENLVGVIRQLHEAIGDPNLQIGISYFLVEDLPAELEDIWRTEIEPYLEELFFDRPDPIASYAWAKIASRFKPS